MRRVRFGRSGVTIPSVSLGTWGHGGPNKAGDVSVGWSGQDDNAATQALLKAFGCGITHWDTADVYGNGHAESLIGQVWDRVPRDEIFLATKVGWDRGPYDHFYQPEQIRSQMERSLRNLRTDFVDLYYLHHCDFGEQDEYLEDAISTVREFQREGKVRFIGLSDWKAGQILRFIEKVDPDVVQPYRNVLDDDYASSGLRAWVDNHDLGVAFFSPLKHGLLLGKYSEPIEFSDGDHRSRYPEFKDDDVIARMQRNRGELERRFPESARPVLHALVGALLTDSPTGCALLGQRTPRHVEDASLVGELLSPGDAKWVTDLYQRD